MSFACAVSWILLTTTSPQIIVTFFASQNSIKSFSQESMHSKLKKKDSVLQKTQLLLTNGMIPLVQVMDKLLKKDEANHESEIFYLATDSLQLLA